MSNARNKAKELLNHYLQLALNKAGCKTDSDTTVEINDIVDSIIDATIEEINDIAKRAVTDRRL
jgi:hypothetical protein